MAENPACALRRDPFGADAGGSEAVAHLRSIPISTRGSSHCCSRSSKMTKCGRRRSWWRPTIAGREWRLADPRAAERQRRRRPAIATRKLRLVGDSAMRDTIGEAGVRRLAAEVEVRLARMAHRPFADAVVQIEQAGLVGDLGARLCGHETARRRGRNRRLLVARALADEAARTDPTIPDLASGARLMRRGMSRMPRAGRGSGGDRPWPLGPRG